MKKIMFAITVLALMMSLPAATWAGSGPKEAEVTLSDVPSSLNVGETIEITATSVKQGSGYTDGWVNAAPVSSGFDPETGTYLSKAAFTAEKPGVYQIRYWIRMTAGNSNTAFEREVERTIEVTGQTTVVGAAVRNLSTSPVYRQDGSISAYSAAGRIYILWSDGSATPGGAVYFYFGSDEISKTIRVSFYQNGNTYIYPVTVTR